MEKLEQWLRIYNASPIGGKIHSPMLLIDDEADNASVNTKKDDDTPTAINAGIRRLLTLFTRSNYVAFTATPYANIFINPDSNDEMLNDDLFPKDFIYALEAPTNYIGARTLFSDGGKYEFMLHDNEDCEYYLPEKHKKDFIPQELPFSLKEAVASFFIANAIRDLRGQQIKHRTMLINVSRFIDVQNQISRAVDGYVRDLQREIKNYCLTGAEALKHEGIAFIRDVFARHFETLDDDALDGEMRYFWDDIQPVLNNAVASIVVRAINGGNAPKNLNYDECEDGLRLIAVGGFSLSRGLTLEGLCTSYFYRNSKMYDTLMQMGRWFGYRPHYADVCQVWMSGTSASWYAYISEASDELRREVRKMQDLGLTPEQFGLGVRSDIDALLVTAINKMRYTHDVPMTVSLNGDVIETPYIHRSRDINRDNYQAVVSWIKRLNEKGYTFADNAAMKLALKHPQIIGVPKELIIEFLNTYKSHYLNMEFRTSDITGLLSRYTDGTVDYWDVMIANGKTSDPTEFCGMPIRPINRVFAVKRESNALQMSGKGARLGSANLGKGGLTMKECEDIEEAARKLRPATDTGKVFSQEEYFNTGLERRPLLVIYPVQLSARTKAKNGKYYDDGDKQAIMDEYKHFLIGLSLGIPSINGRKKETYQYRINLVKWREMLDVDDDYLEETESEE